MERPTTLARKMVAKALVSLQLTKQLINAAADEDAAVTVEAIAGALAAKTEDRSEGMRRFREKRAPKYVGR